MNHNILSQYYIDLFKKLHKNKSLQTIKYKLLNGPVMELFKPKWAEI